MSDIQRWGHYWYGSNKTEDGKWVEYTDHVAALQEAERRIMAMKYNDMHGFQKMDQARAYYQGKRDALDEVVERLEESWGLSWCGMNYKTCNDPDHACRYRREEIATIKGEQ